MKNLTFEQLLKLPPGVVFVIPSGPLAEEIAIKGTTMPWGTGTRVQLFRHINGTGADALVDNIPFETPLERFDTDELDLLLVKLTESLHLYRNFDRNRQAIDHREAQLDGPPSQHRDIPVDVWLDRTPMYFGDKKIISYVYMVLFFFRLPAAVRLAMRPWIDQFNLFVDYQGKRWKVTGASRMGDIQLASNLERENMAGYDERVMLDFDHDGNSAKFSNWGRTPTRGGPVPLDVAQKALVNELLEDIQGAEALGEVDGEKTFCLSESQLYDLIGRYSSFPRD